MEKTHGRTCGKPPWKVTVVQLSLLYNVFQVSCLMRVGGWVRGRWWVVGVILW